MTNEIHDRLQEILHRIAKAATRSGRNPHDIALVAVSKTHAPEKIRAAYAAGARLFGESYAQELKAKHDELSELDICWHFIGHLQRNKAKLIAPFIDTIQALDSFKTSEMLDKLALSPIKALVHINLGHETTKSGIAPEEAFAFITEVKKFSRLNVTGLMCLPPFHADPEKSRPYFRELRCILNHLNQQLPSPLSELSMGMSHDFEIAIEEGSTMVRIETAIFGER
ncbi:MAG: YggS family pyridoxal phosphate-dependent enzyme [Deltaproteobacteria bacterium]|nr:YggS family pyridoxal phosphate-dependent enzyme [Deltaproteobacteria bacterium]